MLLGNIKAKCVEQNTSVAKLEDALGFGRGTIYKWDISSPSIANLKKVADFLGCTVDELIKEPCPQIAQPVFKEQEA